MSQHTRGPWRVDPECYAVRADVLPLSAKTGLDSGVVCVAVCSPEDARLIAAAPEMYELLKCYIGAHKAMTAQTLERYDTEARALLAKVRGKE